MLGRRLPLLPPALVSLILHQLVSQTAAHPYDFTDNYKSSAPAPEDGPPASYHAVRDRNRLPYDIAGVVGGYVACVLIWGLLLLTVGRKMRRKALEPPKALELELAGKPVRPSIKTAPLQSPPLSARSASSWLKKFRKNDSAVNSPQSPDIGSPTSFDQRVIDDHNARAQADMERLYAAVMDHDAKKNGSSVSVNEMEQRPVEPRVESPPQTGERRRPSAINTTRSTSNGESPISPVKAIYPPGYPMTSPMPHDRLRDQQPPASPRSIMSKQSQVSASTTRSKNTRFNLKNLRISGPIQRYPGVDSDDEAHTPLSPRFYKPGAPPSPSSPYDPEELDQVQPLPRPAPQRLGSSHAAEPLKPGITITKSAASSNSSLPLRSFAEPLRSPGIQTTVLDRRVEKLSLTTPKTGVPFTPYSPYMPFTPITPVTPHLVSKKERKAAQKLESRRLAALKEDMVQTPKEIFGDAY